MSDEVTLTLTPATAVDEAVVPTFLRVVHPERLAGWIPLGDAGGILGRSPGDEGGLPAISSGRVSRAHCEITWDKRTAQHAVRDLGSRNGSWLNGAQLGAQPLWLTEGSVLRLGDVVMVYERDLGLAMTPPAGVDASMAPGDSGVMRRLRVQLSQLAHDPAPVLVMGETGTGKERICQALHSLSGRPGSLVVENCATIEGNIAESRLFGHKRGAFTGAVAEHRGLFQSAHKGTLFLDEIGELPLEVQAKLLRALESGEITPLGAPRPVTVDARVVAATHRPLSEMVQEGRFRQDLHARLNLSFIEVPPLRARRGDILSWCQRLLQAWADDRQRAKATLSFDEEAAEALVLHPWPDNLRGIKRLVHQLMMTPGAVSPEGVVTAARLKPLLAQSSGPTTGSHRAARPTVDLTPVEPLAPSSAGPKPPKPSKEELAEALERFGSVRATAKHYDRDRRQIYRWIKAYDLVPPSED
ncbi:MAG: sigma 54-interacting transcriptional regulator [Bradymonadia bacterium]